MVHVGKYHTWMLLVKKHGDRTLRVGSPMFTEKRYLSHQPSTDSTYLDSIWAWQKPQGPNKPGKRMNHDESHGKYMKYSWQKLFLVQTLQNNCSPPRLQKRHTKKTIQRFGQKFRCSKRESREKTDVTFHCTKWFYSDPHNGLLESSHSWVV